MNDFTWGQIILIFIAVIGAYIIGRIENDKRNL